MAFVFVWASASPLFSPGPVWPAVGGGGRCTPVALLIAHAARLPRSDWHTVSHTSEKYMLSLICLCIHPQLKGNLQSKCKDFIYAERCSGAQVSISIKFPVKRDFTLSGIWWPNPLAWEANKNHLFTCEEIIIRHHNSVYITMFTLDYIFNCGIYFSSSVG